MCGINGYFGERNKEQLLPVIKKMNDSIAHRGPDAEGIWSNEYCILGHRRLSIIDTSPAGNQPFHSEDKKLTIVFNGEIYNYIELKEELSKEYIFKTHSDTEVILAAYRTWGIACIEKFFGMFAFALWDETLKCLFVVRDRLGVKPVYYAQTSEGIFFSSEIRAILSTDKVARKISREALADYFRYQTVQAPNTIIEGVSMLMPGSYLCLKKDGIEKKKYWEPETRVSALANEHDLAKTHQHIRQLLRSSVEIRMRADVPFGAFLSGGIDSSIIVGLMSEISPHPVKTFSITFHEKEFDESPYSEVIAKKFKTDHTPIQLSANDFLKLVPAALEAMDHPSGDGPNTYVVSKVTREAGVKMALSGLGGDEVFAGYDVFKRVKSLETRQWMNIIPQLFRQPLGKFMRVAKPSIATEKIAALMASQKIDFAHFYPLNRQVLPDHEVMRLLDNHQDQPNSVQLISEKIQTLSIPTLSKVSIAEIETYMQNVLLRDADQMSMAHSLEVRVPFLDHRLVEYVLGVSDEKKYPHTAKELLTNSVRGLLPDEVIHRPKMGFTFPWAVWMRNELRGFCEENLNALSQVEHIDHKAVQLLWKRFQNGDKMITWSRIWPMVVLGHWVKQHHAH
jgi:asparagine synthase (glutamine-hydrolysing)